jgi:hypothetical protein
MMMADETLTQDAGSSTALLAAACCWVRRCPNPVMLQAENGTFWCAWHADEHRYADTPRELQRLLLCPDTQDGAA